MFSRDLDTDITLSFLKLYLNLAHFMSSVEPTQTHSSLPKHNQAQLIKENFSRVNSIRAARLEYSYRTI